MEIDSTLHDFYNHRFHSQVAAASEKTPKPPNRSQVLQSENLIGCRKLLRPHGTPRISLVANFQESIVYSQCLLLSYLRWSMKSLEEKKIIIYFIKSKWLSDCRMKKVTMVQLNRIDSDLRISGLKPSSSQWSEITGGEGSKTVGPCRIYV